MGSALLSENWNPVIAAAVVWAAASVAIDVTIFKFDVFDAVTKAFF